jgi:hypothetical protein
MARIKPKKPDNLYFKDWSDKDIANNLRTLANDFNRILIEADKRKMIVRVSTNYGDNVEEITIDSIQKTETVDL